MHIVEYSAKGFRIKGRKPTCISATLADDINPQIPIHDGIMSLYFFFYPIKDFDSSPE